MRSLRPLILRLVISVAIASSFIWTFWGQYEDVGGYTEIKGGSVYVSASTSLQAILMSLLGVVVYCIILNTRVDGKEFRVAPLWKRIAAFVVDFWFSVFILGALFGFVEILLEANRTGVFRWHFQRDYWVSSDALGIVFVIMGLVAFVAYFLLPLMCASQTVGNWIFRLATVNSQGHVIYLPFAVAARRLYAAFRGLTSPLRMLNKRDDQGRTFYDIESGFTVVSY